MRDGSGTSGPGAAFRPSAVFALVVIGLSLALVGSGLARSGLWEPWETDAVEAARTLREKHWKLDPLASEPRWKEASRRPPLGSAIVSASMSATRVSAWGGRLGGCLAVALSAALLYLVVAWMADERTARWSALAMITLPQGWLHGSLLAGDAASILASTMALGGLSVAMAAQVGLGARLAAWAVGSIGLVLGALASGVLVGAVVPLAAVTVAAVLVGRFRPDPAAPERLPLLVVSGLVALVGGAVVVHLLRREGLEDLGRLLEWFGARADRPGESLAYVLFAGGPDKARPPPGFEALLEQVLHGAWPWAIVLPFAVAHLARAPADERPPRQLLRTLAIVGLSGAYLAGAFLSAHIGLRPLSATPLLAVTLGLWLAGLERDGAPRRLEAIGIAVVMAMLLRDWSLYPASLLRSLELADLAFPESLHAGRIDAPVALLFGAVAYFVVAQGAGARPATVVPWLRRAVQAVRGRLLLRVLWFAACAVWIYLLVSAVVIATGVELVPWSLMSRLGRRVHLVLLPLPLGLLGAWIAYQLGWEGVRRIAGRRVWLLVAVAGLAAVAGVHGLLPRLGRELSARQVFETLQTLRRSGEPLGEFRTKTRSASAYGLERVEELSTASAVAGWLDAPGRRWVVFPESELAAVHSAIRSRVAGEGATSRDLALRVLDDTSSRLYLGSNALRSGETDENPLSRAVLSREPAPPQHRIFASFEGKIEYLGFDLEGGPELGAGEEFTITYHFRCKSRPPPYKMFVHIDGQGARLNGDHDPVGERYPLRYWASGDYILDRQTLRVPAHFRPGDYTIFLGFFEGERRLRVTEGPADDVNRVKGGTLRVR